MPIHRKASELDRARGKWKDKGKDQEAIFATTSAVPKATGTSVAPSSSTDLSPKLCDDGGVNTGTR